MVWFDNSGLGYSPSAIKTKTMKKMCFKVNVNIEDEKIKRRFMKCLGEIEGVESVAVDMKER